MHGLKEKREALKLTQAEVGMAAGVNANAISNYETGKREPNIEILKKLAAYFKCSIDELI
jgi:transcriptional regulator with XRE-family HTH domain